MSFWDSEVGQITGSAQDAFTQSFGTVPNDSQVIAKINKFTTGSYDDVGLLQIEWEVTQGEFTGTRLFQKLKVYDAKPNTRHRALNMLMLLYQMYNLRPAGKEAPTDAELLKFVGKFAGLKVQETPPNDHGKIYNWISEVHPAAGYKLVTGERVEVVVPAHMPAQRDLSSSFDRYNATKVPAAAASVVSDDDIPF